VPEGITIADAPDVTIRRVSRYGRELTGKPYEAIEGISVERHVEQWDVYCADGRTRARGEDLPLTRATRRGELVRDEVWVLGNPAGQRIPVLCNAGPIRDAAGKITGGIIAWRDITERKLAEERLQSFNAELEERIRERTDALERAYATIFTQLEERKNLEAQLQQAEKMESIGLLAGGIAHDFSNILNIIKGYTWLLHAHRCNGEDISEISEVIDEAIERGSSTVHQLLTLASKTELELKPIDTNEMINDLARLIKRTFPNNIEISVKPGADVPAAMADRNHISQALLNLCVNARDAMPSGGRLTLATGVANGRDLRDRYIEVEHENYVFIEIADTGEGMDEGTRSRIFEPFFTTKGTKGTGLGLSMVYGIVKNHHGLIDVESELQRGTKFRIYLPVAAARQEIIAA
jgi:PAS domain S-box-containing protein